MAAASRAVVIAYVDDVLNAARPEALDRLVANEALAQRTAALHRAFPDLRVTVREIACEGDMVAVHLSARGTHAGIFQGVPPTNLPWSASCTALYRPMRSAGPDTECPRRRGLAARSSSP